LQPVFVGDTLSTSSQVIGLRQNSSGKSGVVWVRSISTNQRGEPVLSWVRWVMVHKSDLNRTAPMTVVPTLPTFVAPENLSIPSYLSAKKFDSKVTGGQYFWEDYQVGERINHAAGATINPAEHSLATRLYQNNARLHFDDYQPGERINHAAGVTINPAEHSLATRLYQNNARLHFDDFLMKNSSFGQRLVYGGVVISLCRALSFEGLENALSILAINAGTHANPSFAGDTIYTVTEVLDAWELPSHADIGALKLRMIGLKNMLPTDFADFKTNDKYHENVVLDLDYTVAMPRRGN
jgi:2-methylfumaryl-CoA hydratase